MQGASNGEPKIKIQKDIFLMIYQFLRVEDLQDEKLFGCFLH